MSDMPKQVHIKEVGPREGFQFEMGDISLEKYRARARAGAPA